MAIELVKRGVSIDLLKDNANLKVANIALSWGANKYDGNEDFDLDVTLFCLTAEGKCRDDRDIVFYGQLKHESGAVIHSGDERTGAKEGDDEVITIDFAKIPAEIERVVGVVSIYKWEERGQNFGMVQGAKARVDNAETGEPLYQYNLEDNFSSQTGVKLFEFKRVDGSMRFKVLAEGYNSGLGGFVTEYGLKIKGMNV